MATNRRDIELIISAKETTGRSFKQVTDNISALNSKIAEQISAAERGEVSLRDLRQTQEQLAQAGRDLSAIQGQIDAYAKLVATSEKVGTAAEKARQNLTDFQTALAAAEKVTEAQEAKLQRLENAVTRTSAAVEKNQADLRTQTEVLNRAGIATDQLDNAQTGLVNTARQIGAGLTQVNTAIDGYSINVARARDAEQQLAAQQGFERKIAEAQRLGDASRFVQLYASAIDTAKAADNQLSALSGFRAVGQMAAEASQDVSRFVEAGQSMAISSSQVAAGLRSIIDPGAQALATLNGVEKAIRDADAASGAGVKNVTILNNAYNNLAESSAALLRQGALVDTFRQQESAVNNARLQFQQAQGDVQRLGTAMQRAEVPTEALVNELAQAEARLEATGRALAQEETRLGTLSRELNTAGINTKNLANEQVRLEAAATQAGNAMRRIETATGRNGARTNGFLGLKPQDLTNVGYQINDIVVSLTSGQKPLTVFIQQGAQLAQIPGFLSAIAGMAVRFAPLLAVALAVGAALKSVYDDSERLAQAQRDLAQVPTGAALDPQKYADTAKALEDLGAKASDVREAMLSLAEEGFTQDQITRYSAAAQELSERLGVNLVQATQLLVDVQKGGIDTVYELAQKTNDLTTADLDHAEALFRAGKAAEARQYVLDRVAERNAEIAAATRSNWTPAVDNLRLAWSKYFGWLDEGVRTSMANLRTYFNEVAVGLTYITGLLAGKGFQGAQADAFKLIQQQRNQASPNIRRGATDQQIRDRQYTASLETQYNYQKAMTREQRLQLAEQKARQDAQSAGVSKSVEDLAVAKARTAEEQKLNDEAARGAKRVQSARDKAARAAKAEENRRTAAQQQLEGQLRQLNRAAFTGESASLEERLSAIDEKYASIYDTVKKLRALGVNQSADGTSLDLVTKQVEATKQRLKAEETIKYYQEQSTLLEKQRSAEIDRVTDAQTRGAITTKEAMAQAAEINDRLSPQIVKAAQQALVIAKQIAGANPSPEMVSWIASLERIITSEGTNNIVAKVGLQGLDETSGKLDNLIKQRDELVKSYQTLNELGIKSDAETRDLTAKAYASQASAISPLLTQLREQVELLHNTKDALSGLPVLTDTAYQTWLAKIDAVNAGLTNTDARITQVNQAAMNGIANGVTDAFNNVSNSIAGLIRGTQSWGDVLNSVLNSGINLAASFLKEIANVLVKMLALKVAKSIIGGSTGGFGSLFFHDGGVVGSQGGSFKRKTGGSDSWAGAPKFHSGGGVGLAPDEYKAVLKRGEEVLTEDNPRHINNVGSGSSSPQQSLKQVLYLDPEQVVSAMQGRSGVKTFLTLIRTNKETIKQVLG